MAVPPGLDRWLYAQALLMKMDVAVTPGPEGRLCANVPLLVAVPSLMESAVVFLYLLNMLNLKT